MDFFHFQRAEGFRPGELDVEIVERKGIGHPDTLCDIAMEEVSRSLSRRYLEKSGRMLHYNCDKGMLIAGRASQRFGGGKILEPMRLIMGDRATLSWKKLAIDVEATAIEAAERALAGSLRFLEPATHLRFQFEMRPASEELSGLYSGKKPRANDTATCVGYAPMTETEILVLDAEQHLNSPHFKEHFPGSGEDVKVMGVRRERVLGVTVAMPLLDRFVDSEQRYFEAKEEIQSCLQNHLCKQCREIDRVEVEINVADRTGLAEAGTYLSVLGTSAEGSDSGEVGRGNRVNGLISFCRPGGSEAAAGKNPRGHVGKIYNVLAFKLAEQMLTIEGMQEAMVWLSSRIGFPVNHPFQVFVRGFLQDGSDETAVSRAARNLVEERLENLSAFCRELTEGVYPIC